MRQWRFIILVCLIPTILLAQSGRKKVLEGNKLFTEEKFEEANGKYRDALLDAPESPVINYDIAGTQYKIGKFEEALENYGKSMSPRLADDRTPEEDRLLRSQIHYNRGNALYRMNKFPEAIQEYQETLKLNPLDEDAKYNLEFVRNKLKNQSQDQQDPQNQQQQDQQQPQDQQNQQQQDQQQQQEEQQEKKQEQKEQENQTQDQQENQEQQSQEEPGEMKEMSKEDAERILNALKEDEKDEQQKRKMKVPANARVLKDW